MQIYSSMALRAIPGTATSLEVAAVHKLEGQRAAGFNMRCSLANASALR